MMLKEKHCRSQWTLMVGSLDQALNLAACTYQFLPSGVALVVAGGKGRGNNSDQLGSPYGMAFDRDGSLLCVAGSMNDRVVSWKMGGSHGVVVAGGMTRDREHTNWTLHKVALPLISNELFTFLTLATTV